MTDPKALAENATKRDTFDFAAAILDRSYPELDVPVYLNEALVQKYLDALETRDALDAESRASKGKGGAAARAEAMDAAQTALEDLATQLRAEEYVVRLRGISPEKAVAIEKQTLEDYPIEYEEDTVSPTTGRTIKGDPKESDERNSHFAALLRQAHIVSVTSPDGAVDEDFSDVEKVKRMFVRLPLLAAQKIDEGIQACTISVDYYRGLVNEVF